LLATAVAAINKSGMAICLRLFFNFRLMSTAAFATSLSKGNTWVFYKKLSQKSICPKAAPVYISYSVMAEIQ
jgi:hypothetical protein